MVNDIETGSATGSNYLAAYVGGVKIKTDSHKQQTGSNVITHQWPILFYSRNFTSGVDGKINPK